MNSFNAFCARHLLTFMLGVSALLFWLTVGGYAWRVESIPTWIPVWLATYLVDYGNGFGLPPSPGWLQALSMMFFLLMGLCNAVSMARRWRGSDEIRGP